jgi:precorrin-3B methylase
MLTVVLIGNASTFTHSGKVITPRGYAVANGPLSATAPATD